MVRIDNDISRRNLAPGTPWPPLTDVRVLAAGTKVEPPGATFGPRRQTHPFLSLFDHLIAVVLDSEAFSGALALPTVELMLRLYLVEDTTSAARAASLPEAVERCLVYARGIIADSSSEPLTLDRLAAATHVSPQHLCRVFKTTLGLPPMEVVRLLRIDHSVTYLERTQLQVKEIARRCGFANAFHYSKVFRSAFEMSPTAYREAFLRGHVVRTLSPVLRRLAAQRILVDEARVTDYINRVEEEARASR